MGRVKVSYKLVYDRVLLLKEQAENDPPTGVVVLSTIFSKIILIEYIQVFTGRKDQIYLLWGHYVFIRANFALKVLV